MGKSIIIFDGECHFCNSVVGWLLRFASRDIFEFVPFQSPKGQKLLKVHNFPTTQLTTVILIDQHGTYTHSDGFLKIVAQIPEWRLVATLLAIIPRIIRDAIYTMASRNRVRWFGKSNSCSISLG